MIRVDTDGVMQYKLVEDTQVVRTETRTIAVRLTREDADRIFSLTLFCSSCNLYP